MDDSRVFGETVGLLSFETAHHDMAAMIHAEAQCLGELQTAVERMKVDPLLGGRIDGSPRLFWQPGGSTLPAARDARLTGSDQTESATRTERVSATHGTSSHQ